MINMIRADLYRITRGKVVFVTLAVAIVASIALITIWASVGPGTGEPFNLNGVNVMVPTTTVNGADSIGLLMQIPHFLLTILMLPLTFCVAVPIFAEKTAKNDIAFGMSRIKLYISKLGGMVILITLMYLLYIGVGTLLATILGGFGTVATGFWTSLLQAMGMQLFILIALGCLTTFLALAIKKPFVLAELYFVFIFVPAIITAFAAIAGYDISWLLRFDLMANIHVAGSLLITDAHNLLNVLGVGVAWMALTSIAGIAMFQKAEIK